MRGGEHRGVRTGGFPRNRTARDPMSKNVVCVPVAAVAGDGGELFEALAFLAAEELFGGDQIGDVQPGRRPLRQRDCAGLDAVAILQTVEPALRDRVDPVVRPGHGPENRPGCVGIASQVDDLGHGLLEAVGRQQQVKAGRDASRRESHCRALANRLGTVLIGFVDQSRQGAITRRVEHRLGVGDRPREASAVLVDLDDDVAVSRRRSVSRP